MTSSRRIAAIAFCFLALRRCATTSAVVGERFFVRPGVRDGAPGGHFVAVVDGGGCRSTFQVQRYPSVPMPVIADGAVSIPVVINSPAGCVREIEYFQYVAVAQLREIVAHWDTAAAADAVRSWRASAEPVKESSTDLRGIEALDLAGSLWTALAGKSLAYLHIFPLSAWRAVMSFA